MGIQGISVLYQIEDEAHLMPDQSDTQNHNDDEDVLTALSRKTFDGPGEDFDPAELPESDFVAFATDDVEMTEEDPK